MSWHKAKWVKGNKTIAGEWCYQWASDRFYIRLDPSRNTSNFLNHTFYIYDDHPEFSGWKLVRKNDKNK